MEKNCINCKWYYNQKCKKFTVEKDYATKADKVPETGWLPMTTGQYKGKVVITSLELNAPNGDNATFTASFEGVGALTKV